MTNHSAAGQLAACPPADPYPLGSPRPRQTAERLAQLSVAMGRHLGPLLARRVVGQQVAVGDVAAPLRRVFETMGATFIKYGQVIASSPTLFGDELANEFRSCLDTGPPVLFPLVRRTIESATGAPLRATFASIDEEPLGRASLAVVHKATLRDGRTAAIKVLRPGIERRVAIDLAVMRMTFDTLAHRLGLRALEPLSQLLDGLRQQLEEELDLRNEAAVMRYFRELPASARLPLVTVPEPYDTPSRKVLVMEFLDGVPVDDLARVQELGHDPVPLVEQVVKAWFMTALQSGVFHGDVHAGNILLLRDGRLGVIDWGIVGRLDPETHSLFRHLIAGALGDEAAWDVVAGHFARQFGGPAAKHLGVEEDWIASLFRQQVGTALTRPFGEISLAELLAAPQREIAARRREHLRELGRPRSRRRKPPFARTPLRRLRAAPMDLPPVDRGMVLLGKQLAYFERYGKLYLGDRPLLDDPEFYQSVLTASPVDAGGG
jgi:aarF domain-containing kinase